MRLGLSGWRGSNKVLEVSDLDKSFDEQPVFLGLEMLLMHGERAGLIGPKGQEEMRLIRLPSSGLAAAVVTSLAGLACTDAPGGGTLDSTHQFGLNFAWGGEAK